MCKQYQRRHGNLNKFWLLRLHQHLDLYCVACVKEEMIDFSIIERRHYLYQTLIYEREVTELQQIELENNLSDPVYRILKLIDQIKFKGNIPNELYDILTSNQRVEDIRDRIPYDDGSNYRFVVNTDESDIDGGESDFDDDQQRVKRRNRFEHAQNIRNKIN